MQSGQKKIIIACLVIIVLMIGFGAVSSFRQRNYGKLTTVVVPGDALVTIDGKRIRVNRTVGVSPGDHTLKATRAGFADLTRKFSIKSKQAVKQQIFLDVTGPEGEQWRKDHPEQAAIPEGVSGSQFDADNEARAKALPLIKSLPFIDLQYRIDAGSSIKDPDNPAAVAIYIKYWADEGKTEALDWIRFKGYDPSKLEIIYTKATSSF